MRRELYELLRFWLDKGVDGLRFDALTFISKDQAFPEISLELLKRNFHREVLAKYDVVSIAEASGVTSAGVLDFVADDRAELNLFCHFEGMMIGEVSGEFKKIDPVGYSRTWTSKPG